MGIDVHTFNFLRYAKKNGDYGKTVTLGRQGFHILESYVSDPYIISIVRDHFSSDNNKYCEDLLIKYFGAIKVDSIDNSDYENASIVHNMNQPIPPGLCDKYDTVIDAGCLEHIYNIPMALKNCSMLCNPGGQILHILPANNFCGHGFWQFTPELFFSLYSIKNGYSDTEVFLAEIGSLNKWYKVKKPNNGQRVTVHSSNKLHVLVRTVMSGEAFSHENVQQSDYIHKWEETISSPMNNKKLSSNIKIKKIIKNSYFSLFAPIYHSFYRLRPSPRMKLNSLNPGLEKYDLKSIL